jgi:hypothetical protein
MSFVPKQERESIPGPRLGRIAAVSVVIVVASIYLAWRITRALTTHEAATFSHASPPPPLGTVERTLVDERARGMELRAAQRAELARFRWADRDAGIVRIPIDRAIDLYAADAGAAR